MFLLITLLTKPFPAAAKSSEFIDLLERLGYNVI